ncbi:ATP-binding protein [Blautia glucerasea]|uniref:ATP-binding protein n=1 Tax=Blautia glucerasea TaxID=536633 RepID=UPI001D05F192|nr:SbcC/MukB-like Walker B domain-containing protein [Blautia glucerasea]MCB6544538.1 AAA family ATPase [Blautia glucerasea]
MKKLTRMKLINWHRFTNCTIDFGSSTLISGENGAGKSTLLDAIQFVVTCSASAFNKAAHENGKRKLTGYIRCKTGRENKPYERTGQLSAHIALEFYEESKKRHFIIGAVVDSASEGQETTVRYLIDKQQFSDEMFLHDRHIRSITEFRAANKGIKQWCKTQSEAKKMIQGKLGRIEDKFFRLIPKALAFKPIDDIKDFVYSYVLDEKEVNIDILRENVRTYQDMERTLDSVKKRIFKLEQIEKHHDDVLDCEKKDQMYEFFLQQAQLDITKENIQRAQSEIFSEEYRLKQIKDTLDQLKSEWENKQEMETNLRVELKQNKDFLALEEQEKEKEHLEAEARECLNEKKDLMRSVRKAADNAMKLLNVQDVDNCIREYNEALKQVDRSSDIVEIKELTSRVIEYKKSMYEKIHRKIAEVHVEIHGYQTERDEITKKIEKLEKKKLTYPSGVERLVSAVKEEFAQIGRESDPHVLCELLEIKDEQWRNAVEGYLNTQRFYVLVEPENFDIALGTYDRLRREKKAFGAGLINAQNMEKYEEAPEGTLASVVTSKNRYARRYINMVLGKVILCDRYEDLKKYPVSITRECMRYQNRVANAIKPEIFNVPFIGSHALKVQLELAKNKRIRLSENISELETRLKAMESVIIPLSTEADVDIKYRLDVISRLHIIQTGIKKCEDNIKTLKKNATLIQKQVQLEALQKLLRDLQREIGDNNQKIGMLNRKKEEKESQLTCLMGELVQLQKKVTDILEMAGDVQSIWIKDYETQTAQKSYVQFRENFDRRRKANETIRNNAENQMIEAMITYKTEHDFGAAPSMGGYPEFASVYERLKTSELLDYEEKVQSARISAEEEFREQFLAKLQENMKQAQGEFKELNKALKDITFSNERYEFIYMPSGHYRNYYDMIMDDFNVIQGESIFSGIFHETHKEVIDELFDRLSLDNESSSKTLAEFTDYRTYMDYDIKIIHSDGTFSYYSKVCEEKSGGETQTPFYVTVAASFVQLYTNNIGGEAAGLVMFDEAFNNMDDERIGGVLEFMNRLPLQLIIAAPPDKIQYIAPSMEETLLAMTDEKVSFVEKYCHEV